MNKNEQILKRIRCIAGDAAYTEICREFGGCNVRIPAFRGGFVTVGERNKAIRLDYYSGMDREELARKYDLELSTIYKIIASPD